MAKGLKTGGRKKGIPNKTTEELRDTVQAFIENNIDGIQENFDLLEPKEKLLFIEKMLNYSLPRMQATQLTGAEGKDLLPTIKGITFDPE